MPINRYIELNFRSSSYDKVFVDDSNKGYLQYFFFLLALFIIPLLLLRTCIQYKTVPEKVKKIYRQEREEAEAMYVQTVFLSFSLSLPLSLSLSVSLFLSLCLSFFLSISPSLSFCPSVCVFSFVYLNECKTICISKYYNIAKSSSSATMSNYVYKAFFKSSRS